jgi:hypothetical protein
LHGGARDLSHGPPCNGSFCPAGQVCEQGVCHLDCGAGVTRCGLPPSESCCAAGDVCYLGACTTPGAPCGTAPTDGGACSITSCPDGQYCEASVGRCLPLAHTVQCEYRPPVGSFSPKVKWEWQGGTVLPGYDQVMMTPMVADLDGNCMPDIVFTTFAGSNYGSDGVLRAVRGDGGGDLFNVTDPGLRLVPGAQLALADVDGDGKVEIFACHQSFALIAFHYDGTLKWMSQDRACGAYDAPSVADLDHNGVPEVIVGFSVHDAQTGALIGSPPNVPTYGGYGAYTTAAELDGDDTDGMEIAAGNIVYHRDGTLYWDQSGGNTGYPAVADLDGDGLPEVVAVVPASHSVYAYHHDGTLYWGPKDVNNGVATPQGPTGGGPPTIADFDGNGTPDVATAGGYGYLVLDGHTGNPLWQSTDTTDTSSRVTGSSVFDFEGDGPAEAVYNDEHNLRVYRGADGKVLVKLCSTSGTLWENPVIVDVDADDHAEIVVMDNNYGINTCDQDLGGGPSHTGFHVIGDAMNRWVRTRRIWNQHTYHVTNIVDDATVPQHEPRNWTQTGLDNFRQNVQTKNLFSAADLVPRDLASLTDKCPASITLVARVLNQGAATAPAGVPVTFYRSMPTAAVLGTVTTHGALLAGASETVSLDIPPLVMGGDADTPQDVYVTVDDDGTGHGVVNECDETNNTSPPITVTCHLVQ